LNGNYNDQGLKNQDGPEVF